MRRRRALRQPRLHGRVRVVHRRGVRMMGCVCGGVARLEKLLHR